MTSQIIDANIVDSNTSQFFDSELGQTFLQVGGQILDFVFTAFEGFITIFSDVAKSFGYTDFEIGAFFVLLGIAFFVYKLVWLGNILDQWGIIALFVILLGIVLILAGVFR